MASLSRADHATSLLVGDPAGAPVDDVALGIERAQVPPRGHVAGMQRHAETGGAQRPASQHEPERVVAEQGEMPRTGARRDPRTDRLEQPRHAFVPRGRRGAASTPPRARCRGARPPCRPVRRRRRGGSANRCRWRAEARSTRYVTFRIEVVLDGVRGQSQDPGPVGSDRMDLQIVRVFAVEHDAVAGGEPERVHVVRAVARHPMEAATATREGVDLEVAVRIRPDREIVCRPATSPR